MAVISGDSEFRERSSGIRCLRLIGDEGARSHTKSTHVAHGGAGPDPAVRRSGYLFSARSSRRGGLVVRSKR
jgi:hypothetical protein